MKKMLAILLMAILALGTCTAAFAEEEPSEAAISYTEPQYKWDFYYQAADTKAIRKAAVEEQGTVVTLEYEAPAYQHNELLGVDETVTKQLNVYLPYGYDESQQYNVVYLMHGGGENQDYWLGEGGHNMGEGTRNVLDYMIMNGICDPVIIVTPTFYSKVEGMEIPAATARAFGEELGDEFLNTEDMLYTWFFQYELRNDIIPLVESTYSTYAGGDTSLENLIATRDHRAYCGLSMGSITSFHSIMMGNTDIIGYVGSYSGCKSDLELFREFQTNTFGEYPILFWYNGNGLLDQALNEHVEAYDFATTEMADRFIDGENSVMVVMPDGKHGWTAWVTDLYNCLMVFFK